MAYDSEKLTNAEVKELEEFYKIKLPKETNDLYKDIKETLYWSKKIEDVDAREPHSWFNPPIAENEITDWEKTYNITIPTSYKDWLCFSDGSSIRMELGRFYGLNELKLNSPYVSGDMVIIGTLIGDGEYICFSKYSGDIVRCFEGKEDKIDGFREILNSTIIRIMKKS